MKTQRKGTRAETIACHYLKQQGLQLIERNFSAKTGEIDLIMLQAGTYVFVEVRYRSGRYSNRYGSAANSINAGKQLRLLRTASFYLQRKRLGNSNARIDAVDISGALDNPAIEWIQNAVMAPA